MYVCSCLHMYIWMLVPVEARNTSSPRDGVAGSFELPYMGTDNELKSSRKASTSTLNHWATSQALMLYILQGRYIVMIYIGLTLNLVI